jgi:hypothetical protein
MPRDLIIPIIDSPTVNFLRQGLDRIRQGWGQRQSILRCHDGHLVYCAGAAVIFDDHQSNRGVCVAEALTMLDVAIDKLTGSNGCGIVQYNDNWSRTKADVEMAYEVAIELQIRKEQGLVI